MVSLAPPLAARPAAPARDGAQAAAPWIAAVLVAAVVLFAPQVLNDGDTYWHLAAGEWMLAHRQVLKADVFSYTFAGRPWHTHEWLAEVLMALAYRAAGWSAVVVLSAAAAGAAVGVMARRLQRALPPLSLTLALALVFGCAAPSLLARPHLLALPLLAVWVDRLLAARAAGRAPPLGLAALMTLWANLHGGYVLGLAILGPLAAEAVAAAPAPDRFAAARDWILFAAASLAAALVTPFGVSGLTYPLQLLAMHSLPVISEWRPADFGHPGPLEITLLVTLYALLARGVRVPPLRLALLLLLLHMALQQSRHQIVLAVVGALLLAEPLGAAAAQPETSPMRRPRLAAGLCLAAALSLALVRLALPVTRSDALTSPVSALAHVPPQLAARPVFNSYGFGGFLIWHGVRPFIDGRGDMYGDDFLEAEVRAERGDRADLENLLARWKVAWTLLSPQDAAVPVLDREPGWRRLYADRYAVVHVREPAAP
jgi:hypothetical protein